MAKKEYISPELTVIMFRNERGYAGSLEPPNFFNIYLLTDGLGGSSATYKDAESFSVHNNWTENNDNFWNN